MEKNDYYTEREVDEILMFACQREAEKAVKNSFEEVYWNKAVKDWNKILTNR